MIYSGLINELSYCQQFDAAIVGVDRDRQPINSELWKPTEMPENKLRRTSVNEILERAIEILDSDSLVVLSRLAPDEIGKLRELGRSYFDMLSLSGNPLYRGNRMPDFGTRFVYTIVDYWKSVCEYLSTHHRSMVKKPTKLALFLGELPGALSKISQSAFTVTVDLAHNIAASQLPAAGPVLSPAKSILERAKLQFLFVCDTEDFRRIKSVLPDKSWFRRSKPKGFMS
jgi:hypothetical protein